MTKKPKANLKISLASKVLIVTTVLLTAFIAYDMGGFGGNIHFYSKWHECGNKPYVAKGSGYMNAGVSHYVPSPDFSILRGYPEYFCTPKEAELAGYSASRFQREYPNLTQEERRRIAEDRLRKMFDD